MKYTLLVGLLLPCIAYATGTQNGSIHHNYINTPSIPSSSESVSSSTANAAAKATALGGAATAAGGVGTATAAGGAGGSANYSAGSSNLYVLPPPVIATPLPPGVCPQGDSYSFSIGWNFFSYAESRTRTEMECLQKTLAYMYATIPPAPPAPRLDPTDHIHPTCTVVPEKKVVVKKKTTIVPAKKQCN